MLTGARIQNFRCLEDLRIRNLRRINLFGGPNQSGKSSLLEALFLLVRSEPELLGNSAVIRFALLNEEIPSNLHSVLWLPLFHNLDVSQPISIEASDKVLGSLKLQLASSKADASKQTIARLESRPSSGLPISHPRLSLKLTQNQEIIKESEIRLDQQVGTVHSSPWNAQIPSLKIDNHADLKKDAQYLASLRAQKRLSQVVNALQVIDPRVKDLESNSTNGVPMIWVDAGLSTLIPLSMIGEGMARVVRLAMALALCEGGVVFVDELENGVHHSLLPNFWKIIDELSYRNQVQVLATTHRYECVMAGLNTVAKRDFRYQRLENINGNNQSISYDEGELIAAVEHQLEIR